MAKGNGKRRTFEKSSSNRLMRPSYPQWVRDEAKRLWLKGYSSEKISKLPHMPDRRQTIDDWKIDEDWRGLAKRAVQKANNKMVGKIADSMSEMDDQQLDLLSKVREHINVHLGFDILDPKDLKALTESLDKTVKNERLIRGQATDRQEADVVIGWKDILYAAANDDGFTGESDSEGLSHQIPQLPE